MPVKRIECIAFLFLANFSNVTLGKYKLFRRSSPTYPLKNSYPSELTTECLNKSDPILTKENEGIFPTENGFSVKSSAEKPQTEPAANTVNDILGSLTASKLNALIQRIYAAQSRVELEANEIKRAQSVATAAQKSLEEASNNARFITAALQRAQQEIADAAVRAQTAQLQLAAHDQLLFAARQKVDALSAEMVGLQVVDGVIAPKPVVNLSALLQKLKEPLLPYQTPTPIPAVDEPNKGSETKGFLSYDDYFNDV